MALGLSAIKILPYVEWLLLYSERSEAASFLPAPYEEQVSLAWATGRQVAQSTLNLLFPIHPEARLAVRPYLASHMGLVPVLLVILGLRYYRQDVNGRFFTWLAVAGFMAVALSEPAVVLLEGFLGRSGLLGMLKSQVNNSRLVSLLTPGVAIAAAFSTHHLLLSERGRPDPSPSESPGWGTWRIALPLSLFTIGPFLILLLSANLRRYYQVTFIVAYAAVIGIVFLAYRRNVLTGRALGAVLILLTVGELFYSQGIIYRPAPKEFFYPETPSLKFLTGKLKGSPFRVASLTDYQGGLTYLSMEPGPNTLVPFGLEDIGGNEGLAPRRQLLLYSMMQRNPRKPLQIMTRRTELRYGFVRSKLFDLLNIKYLITTVDRTPPHDWDRNRFRVVYSNELVIYENRSVLPRAFVVPRAEVVTSGDETLKRLLDAAYNPREIVFLEEAVNRRDLPKYPESPTSVSIQKYEPEYASFKVAGGGGFLVLSDTYHSGWKVRVDGQPARLYRANYFMRAVPVPAGDHLIEFEYRPLSFRLGVWITFLSLMVGVAFIIGTRKR